MTGPTADEIVSAYVSRTAAALTRYGAPGRTRSGFAPSEAQRYDRIQTPGYRRRAIEGVQAALDAGPGGRVLATNAGDRACAFVEVVSVTVDGGIVVREGDHEHPVEPTAIAAIGTKVHQDRRPVRLSAGDRIVVRDRGNLAERTIDADGTYRLVYPEDGNATIERVDEAFPWRWTKGGTVPPQCRIVDTPPPGFPPSTDPGVVWIELLSGGHTRAKHADLEPIWRPSAQDVNEANDRIIADRLARGEW